MMAKRARETFFTAAQTLDGRQLTFQRDQVVPDAIAKAVASLVYDDGAVSQGSPDGTPPDVHTCESCDFVAKSAAGLAAHSRSCDA